MANRNDPDAPARSNDPATTPRDDPRPHQSELNASRPRSGEAASRAEARTSGRSAAKWIAIILAVIVALFIIGAIFGGGAWIWGPTEDETEVVE